MSQRPPLTLRTDARVSCSPEWEAAYHAFESPEAQRRKLRRRLERFGARSWPRDARILELFCGSGAGLEALAELGFEHLEGVDLSRDLLERYAGPARCYVADCRDLAFEAGSHDVVVIHGGLHHLPSPEDLERVLAEICRVLAPDGRLCVTEPWPTPFLALVHALARRPWVRRLSRKADAFQTMVEHELETYRPWLASSREILEQVHAAFVIERQRIAWGKISWLGRPRKDSEIEGGGGIPADAPKGRRGGERS